MTNRHQVSGALAGVVGYTGATYAESIWDGTARVARMTLSEWRACRQDVMRAPERHGNFAHMFVWEFDVEMPEEVLAPTGGPDEERLLTMIHNAPNIEQLEAIVAGLPPGERDLADAVLRRCAIFYPEAPGVEG